MFNGSNVLFNVLYADDTCIYISGSDINALFDVSNIELVALLESLNANKLTLNVDKTFYMLFHRRCRKNTKNYNFFCLLFPYCSNFLETEIITFM